MLRYNRSARTGPGRSEDMAMPSLLRFAAFEINLTTGELRKSGRRIRLQPQPFRVLALLLERPCELVTRSELQQKLWGENTLVDFEHGINFAVKQIREALGDDAEQPRYIETLPRRGYRFIAKVEPFETAPMHRAASESNKPALE